MELAHDQLTANIFNQMFLEVGTRIKRPTACTDAESVNESKLMSTRFALYAVSLGGLECKKNNKMRC